VKCTDLAVVYSGSNVRYDLYCNNSQESKTDGPLSHHPSIKGLLKLEGQNESFRALVKVDERYVAK